MIQRFLSIREKLAASSLSPLKIVKFKSLVGTFHFQIDRIYHGTPTNVVVIDHEKKRTFVIRKNGLPDASKNVYETVFDWDGIYMNLLIICFKHSLIL